MQQVSRLARILGPYYLIFWFVVVGLVGLSLSRLGLMLWQWPRVSSAGEPLWMLVQGVRADLIMLGLWLALPVLLAPLLGVLRAWPTLLFYWCLSGLGLLIFIELSTPSFIAQYDIRPNRLYIEYLKYPKEVFATLWHGFRLPLLLGSAVTVLLIWLAARFLGRLRQQQVQAQQVQLQQAKSAATSTWSRHRQLWVAWPLVVLMVFISIRSTTQHRPANPALFAITSDALVNSLIISSGYSVLYAVYSMRHEARSSDIYGELPTEQMLTLAKRWPWLSGYQFNHPELPTWHRQQATVQRDKPLNLVIVLQESMGATFVKSLGGVPVTPELEKLRAQGIWLDNLYATGTRSVRGIEAVVAGFAPTPAQSTVKLSGSQHQFTTLASVLAAQGYQTQFIYGGEAHFDNMRSYFTGNGFSDIVDFKQIKKPAFVGSWGASDEDLFNQALTELDSLQQSGKPFFSLIFTSSNHEPFEFPDGRISLHEEPKNTVNNAVKYADWAMGQFFAKAKSKDYWQNTVFLVVADHDNRVYGANLIPLEKFRIPGLILGADLTPTTWSTIASQIDLAPTLLSLMGVNSCHPMTGRDITLDPSQPGRALIQFDNYFALMQDHGLTILKPDGSAVGAQFDSKTKVLTTDSLAVTETAYQQALAEVQLPSYLYREKKYRSEHRCGAAQ